MDKPLIGFLSFLLFIELAVLFADLGFLPSNFLPPLISEINSTQKKIGKISHLQNKVRRKFDQSIVWTESKAHENVFNQDSVLTLKNSSAKINLEGNIQIKLYENTLIVIKAPEVSNEDELKIQFAKGNLRSRLRDKKIALESDVWSFNPSKNSDISFRSTPDKKLEIEVNEGSIQISNKNSPEKSNEFKKGNSLSLEKNGEIESKKIASSFQWQNSAKESRFYYSKTIPAAVQLKWKGEAEKLKIHSNSQGDQEFEIESDQKEIQLELPAGHYFAKLESGNQVSTSFEFEVVEAKYFGYFSPYPRDRLLNDRDYLFSWEKQENVSKYILELSPTEDFENILERHFATGNSLRTKLKSKGPLFWRIRVQDDKSSSYVNDLKLPIYSVSKALAAPNLKGIKKSRIPASRKKKKEKRSPLKKENSIPKGDEKALPKKNSSHWLKIRKNIQYAMNTLLELILIPKASAAEKEINETNTNKQYEYKFEWSAVDGADFYIIEISKSPDFQELIGEMQSTENSLTWASDHTGKVYWRVSAGAYSGLMGVFSEPMEVNLSEIEIHKKVTKVIPVKAIKTKPKSDLKTNSSSLAKTKTLTKDNSNEKNPEQKSLETSNYLSFAYFLSYGKAKGLLMDEEAKYKFTGLKPLELEIQYTRKNERRKYYSSSISYYKNEWEAESSSLSFQEQISEEQIFWDHYFLFAGNWSFGLNLQKREFPIRDGNEIINFKTKALYGFSFLREQDFVKKNLPEKFIVFSRLSTNGKIYDLSGKFLAKWNLKSERNYQMHFDAGFQYSLRSEDAKDFSHYTEVQIGLSIDWGSFSKPKK